MPERKQDGGPFSDDRLLIDFPFTKQFAGVSTRAFNSCVLYFRQTASIASGRGNTCYEDPFVKVNLRQAWFQNQGLFQTVE